MTHTVTKKRLPLPKEEEAEAAEEEEGVGGKGGNFFYDQIFFSPLVSSPTPFSVRRAGVSPDTPDTPSRSPMRTGISVSILMDTLLEEGQEQARSKARAGQKQEQSKSRAGHS